MNIQSFSNFGQYATLCSISIINMVNESIENDAVLIEEPDEKSTETTVSKPSTKNPKLS